MRLVTYDRRGHRRLGAILGGEVVDLPDVVGHPAFPTTLEALVASSGGTVMDAARAALERDEILKEFQDLRGKIRSYEELLGSQANINAVIKRDLQELRDKFGENAAQATRAPVTR